MGCVGREKVDSDLAIAVCFAIKSYLFGFSDLGR